MAVRKKQDDSNLKTLRELVTNGGNRQCFDCGQKGPTYANITIGSFVCTRCSGVLRGITPPHRVKSISMATFSPEEIEFLKSHGNDDCAKTWLGLWDPKRVIHQDQRELMIDKYERKRYYLEPASPLKSLTNAATSKLSSSSSLSSSSTSSLSAASNNINNNINSSNHNNNINNNMTNGYTYLNDNNNINNNIHNKTSNYSRHNGNSSSLNNGHHPNSNGILAPPSPRHHNHLATTSPGSSSANVNQNGTNAYHRPHSSSYFVQQQQHMQQNIYSNGLNKSTTNSNGFTPDSDFVADFGSASIFNASNGSVNKTNMQNDTLGNSINNNNLNNGNSSFGSSNNSSVNENFADFDHAPIYNAAANFELVKQKCSKSTTISNNKQNNCLGSYDLLSNSKNILQNSSNIYDNCYNTLNNNKNNNCYSKIDNYDKSDIFFTVQSTPLGDEHEPKNNNNNLFTYNKIKNNNYNKYNNNCFDNINSSVFDTFNKNNNHTENMFDNLNNFQHHSGCTSSTKPFEYDNLLKNNYIKNDKSDSDILNNGSQWDLWQEFDSAKRNNINNNKNEKHTDSNTNTNLRDKSNAKSNVSNKYEGNCNFDYILCQDDCRIPINSNGFASKSSSSTLNNNSATATNANSTPTADRYAALKDLDEQLRETKSSSGLPTASVFSSSDVVQNSNAANPFKSIQQTNSNPFQTNGSIAYSMNGVTNGSLFDISTQQSYQQTQQHTPNQISNGGFGMNTNFGLFANINNNSVGNGFNDFNNAGLNGNQQQSVIAGSYATMKNPFVTNSVNSNNPFL